VKLSFAGRVLEGRDFLMIGGDSDLFVLTSDLQALREGSTSSSKIGTLDCVIVKQDWKQLSPRL